MRPADLERVIVDSSVRSKALDDRAMWLLRTERTLVEYSEEDMGKQYAALPMSLIRDFWRIAEWICCR